MKAIFILFSSIISCLGQAFTWHDLAMVESQNVSAGICTSNTSWGTDTGNGSNIGDTTSHKYMASSNIFAVGFTCCKVSYRIFRVDGGGTAGTLTAKIWADSGSGLPGALVATSVNTVSSAQVGTSASWADFDFSDVPLSSSTIYWFGLVSATIDASNYYTERGTSTSGGFTTTSSDGTSWTAANTRKWYQSGWSK